VRYLLAVLLTFGVLLRTIPIGADGTMRVYRDGNLCVLTWEGTLVQVVDLQTCLS
jgi:hypothetical protein